MRLHSGDFVVSPAGHTWVLGFKVRHECLPGGRHLFLLRPTGENEIIVALEPEATVVVGWQPCPALDRADEYDIEGEHMFLHVDDGQLLVSWERESGGFAVSWRWQVAMLQLLQKAPFSFENAVYRRAAEGEV